MNFCNNSSCSLLKTWVSYGFVLSPAVRTPRLLEGEASLGLWSAGLPWSFQQVFFVWLGLGQWSHYGLSFIRRWLLSRDTLVPRATRAETSFGEEGVGPWVPNLTFWLSSHRTSEKTSQIGGMGLRLSIRPLTSSKLLLRPNKNLKILSCSTIFLYLRLHYGHLKFSLSNWSNCFQYRFKVLKYWVTDILINTQETHTHKKHSNHGGNSLLLPQDRKSLILVGYNCLQESDYKQDASLIPLFSLFIPFFPLNCSSLSYLPLAMLLK